MLLRELELWDTLYALAVDMTLPWLVGGDFNVICDEEEKFEGLPVHINEVDNFRHYVNTCNLFDLGFKRSIYTWWNGGAEEDYIFKRLDRCLGNMEFQQMWLGLEALLVWSKATYGDIFKKLSILEEVFKVHETQFELNPTCKIGKGCKEYKLIYLYSWHWRRNSGSKRLICLGFKMKLFIFLVLEEEFWKQKASMSWFQDGDRNTKFFHAQVNGIKKRLQLKRIQNSDEN
ncbi:uncharacterized protein [Nicotiana tomentosiformis]|uniref:uncharacterized protein n=1 Tax=Nicotiana tomentosiformis TaxID=4098 RepID=UPI00388C5374